MDIVPITRYLERTHHFPSINNSVTRDKAPALTAENLCDSLQKNLSAMKSARENFIKSESSERIKRALSHSICQMKSNSRHSIYFPKLEHHNRNE